MADNTTLNPGVGGDVIATDDIAGVKHELVKVEFGVDGVATMVADTDGARLPVKVAMAGTATRTLVADTAVAVTVLAANANRKGAYLLNTSSAILYVGLGAVDPTATDFTEQLLQWQSWRVPDVYTGIIKGLWASDPNDGVARVTELS